VARVRDLAVAIADWTCKTAGVDAIFPGGPFERRFREIHTLSQQIQSRLRNPSASAARPAPRGLFVDQRIISDGIRQLLSSHRQRPVPNADIDPGLCQACAGTTEKGGWRIACD
jgi:hypothetical protein